MALHELHPFNEAEIAKLPRKPGVYVLFQIETPIYADSAGNLRQSLLDAKCEFPQASHFSIEALDLNAREMKKRLSKLCAELHLVRTAAFVGTNH